MAQGLPRPARLFGPRRGVEMGIGVVGITSTAPPIVRALC